MLVPGVKGKVALYSIANMYSVLTTLYSTFYTNFLKHNATCGNAERELVSFLFCFLTNININEIVE